MISLRRFAFRCRQQQHRGYLSRRSFTSAVSKANETVSETPVVEEEKPVKKPMTFGRFVLYATGVVSGATFSYYFYQAGGNLHKTEILIGKKLAQLPFYYPPGPSQSEKNSTLPTVSLSPEFVDQISAWFISQDSSLPEGLTREDVLSLVAELGLLVNDASTDDNTPTKKLESTFIEKGRGRLTEHKRLSGVSLPETLEFIDQLSQHSEIDVSEKMHAILGKLVSAVSNVSSGLPGSAFSTADQQALPEVDASDKELLEGELAQAIRTRDTLAGKTSRSDAENGRLQDAENLITEIRSLIARSD